MTTNKRTHASQQASPRNNYNDSHNNDNDNKHTDGHELATTKRPSRWKIRN